MKRLTKKDLDKAGVVGAARNKTSLPEAKPGMSPEAINKLFSEAETTNPAIARMRLDNFENQTPPKKNPNYKDSITEITSLDFFQDYVSDTDFKLAAKSVKNVSKQIQKQSPLTEAQKTILDNVIPYLKEEIDWADVSEAHPNIQISDAVYVANCFRLEARRYKKFDDANQIRWIAETIENDFSEKLGTFYNY